MDFSELAAAFDVYTGALDQVDNAQLALWFNEAQLDLAYDLGPVSSRELAVSAGERLEPEADWLHLLGCDLAYRRLEDGALLFEAGGSGKLYYRALPTPFSGADANQQSELPLPLHYLLAQFAASRYWEGESEGDAEENTQANRWLGYYYQGKELAKSRLPQPGPDLRRWQVE